MLFKSAYAKEPYELSREKLRALEKISNDVLQKEDELAKKAGVKEGSVIIDVPYGELFFSEPRLDKTDISILNKGNIESLTKFTPLSRALQTRATTDWAIMICTTGDALKKVAKKADDVLFNDS